MDIHEYFGVLRRGWALVVLGLLVGIAGGVAANAIQPRTYAATSREILTNSAATGDLTQSLQASNLAEGRIASYVLVATSGLVLQPVIDELKLDTTVQELAGHLSVVAPPSTLIVEITATAATPELAKSIANTVSSVFSDVVENQIENATSPAVGATTTNADGTPVTPVAAPVRIVNIEHASLPTAPTSSNAALLLAVGAILGLALGLVGASLRETLDRRVRGRKDVAAVTDRPVLGQIRPDRGVKSSPIVMHTSVQSAIAESFRGLRASVEHVRSRDEISTFVITAMAPRQGASLVAANLALAIADTATTVVVVDANLQAPNQAEIFDVDAGPGLTDLLTTKISLDEVIAAGPSENIWVVPIGSRRAKSADLLATHRMRALIGELQGRFDVVIIDTPAISTATDATVLGSFGAATLLVVAEGTATRPRLAEALNALAAGGSIPAGVVLNQIPRSTRSRRPAAPASARTSSRVTGRSATPPAAVVVAPPLVELATPVAPAVAGAPALDAVEVPTLKVATPEVMTREVTAPAEALAEPVAEPVAGAEPAAESVTVAASVVPTESVVPAEPAAPAVTVPVVAAAPVEEKVLDIAPPVIESTSTRAAARAARVAAKSAARAAASRSQQPVSRFAPKPPDAVDAAEAAAAAERRSWPAPIIDSVPVIEPVDESSNSVIDVPRGDTGERVSLLAPRPGDLTPDQLAEIVANQFKDDVVYEIPAEAFGSFHLVDAEAFAAVDNEQTILPPFRHTEPEVAPGTLVTDAVDPINTAVAFTVAQPTVSLTEENAAFVIDLLADEPIYDQPRFEDWAVAAPADDSDLAVVEDSAVRPFDFGDEPVEAPVEAVDVVADHETAPVYEVPQVDVVEPPVYEIPVVEAAEPPSDQTAPRPFVAPETWPAPRLVADWEAASETVQRAATVAQPEVAQPALARVTSLPTVPSRERLARESYVLKSRELERAAQERLRYEQDRLEARIREQLEADRRQLAGKLDELLEDTVMMPRSVGDGS